MTHSRATHKPAQPHVSADLQPTQYVKSHLTDQYSNINVIKNQSHPDPAKSQAT